MWTFLHLSYLIITTLFPILVIASNIHHGPHRSAFTQRITRLLSESALQELSPPSTTTRSRTEIVRGAINPKIPLSGATILQVPCNDASLTVALTKIARRVFCFGRDADVVKREVQEHQHDRGHDSSSNSGTVFYLTMDPFAGDWATIGQNLFHMVVFETKNATLSRIRVGRDIRREGSQGVRIPRSIENHRYDDRNAAAHLFTQAASVFRDKNLVLIAPNNIHFWRATEHIGLEEARISGLPDEFSGAASHFLVLNGQGPEGGRPFEGVVVSSGSSSQSDDVNPATTVAKAKADAEHWGTTRRVYAVMHDIIRCGSYIVFNNHGQVLRDRRHFVLHFDEMYHGRIVKGLGGVMLPGGEEDLGDVENTAVKRFMWEATASPYEYSLNFAGSNTTWELTFDRVARVFIVFVTGDGTGGSSYIGMCHSSQSGMLEEYEKIVGALEVSRKMGGVGDGGYWVSGR